MRHKRKTRNFSRFSSYYKATVKSIARAVIIHERIVTTKQRAEVVKRMVDRLVTLGKKTGSLAARRRAFALLGDHGLVKRLFSEIAVMFSGVNGGYTRIVPYKRRRGDNAELAFLELSRLKAPEPDRKEKKPAASKGPEVEIEDKKKVERVEHKETKRPSKKLAGGLGKIFRPKKTPSSS